MPDSAPASPTRAELAKELLLYKMREYSDAFCASWLKDSEFIIWDEFEPNNEWMENLFKECRALGEIAGGWWVWPDTIGDDGDREVFISSDRWKEILDRRERKKGNNQVHE